MRAIEDIFLFIIVGIPFVLGWVITIDVISHHIHWVN